MITPRRRVVKIDGLRDRILGISERVEVTLGSGAHSKRRRRCCLIIRRNAAVALAARALGTEPRYLKRDIDAGHVRMFGWWVFVYGFHPRGFSNPDWGVSVNRCTGRTVVRRGS